MESAICATMPPLFKPLSRRQSPASAPSLAATAKPLSRLNYRAKPPSLSSAAAPIRSAASSGGDLSPLPPHDHDAIVLHVQGMMCEGCAGNVKKLLESRPQVSSATVNLASEIAIVSAVSEEKSAPNWRNQLGEALAQHLTNCGFNSTLRGQEGNV